MSNLYLQSFQKFQIWDIVSSKKEDEHFLASVLNFVTKVYVRLSFNDSYRCLKFLFCFWVSEIH